MTIENQREIKTKTHEKLVEINDPDSGLHAFIAIHNTNLGPALGGTRIFPYKTRNEALKDVLALSKAMTYKCAISGLSFGGGKGVIIGNPKELNKKKVLKAYAEAVDSLKGRFHTGEDVGLTEADVQYMLTFSPYFIGKSNLAGDPSPYAGESAYLCAKVALKKVFGTDNLKDRTIAIKGVGKTGSALAVKFAQEGAMVSIYDIDFSKAAALAKQYPNITIVDQKHISSMPCDIYAPCAMGNDITSENIKSLNAKIVAGTANNQLESPLIARQLFNKNILHIPDYIANGGGLINVANELVPGGYNKKRVEQGIKKLGVALKKILDISSKTKVNPDVVADTFAEKIFYRKKPLHRLAEIFNKLYAKS